MTKQLIKNIGKGKSDGRKEEDARKIITACMGKTADITNPEDAKALIQNTQAIIIYGLERDVYQMAAKVQTHNHIKQILREEISALTDILADWSW